MAKKRPKSSEVDHAAGGAPRAASASQLRALDRQIVELLNQRAAKSLASKGDVDPALPDGAVAVESNDGPLGRTAVEAIFRELVSGIRAARRPTRVAYLGPEYTYSHLAAIARFGQSAELAPVASIAAVFEEVERGQAEFGVVPIENSTDGRVNDALECFSKWGATSDSPAADAGRLAAPIHICGEVPLRIRHCLLGRGSRADLRRVCSKTQPLSQCRNWLAAHLPGVRLVETASTAEAATLAAAEHDTAAIASEQAGANYGLPVLAAGIEDNPDNVTRFAIIGREPGKRTGQDKTALVFEAPHKPGALADAMAIFKRQKLNLTWIESFPIPKARGRYLFFIEFQGHPADLRAKRAIASLAKKSLRLTVLGSYAQAEVVS